MAVVGLAPLPMATSALPDPERIRRDLMLLLREFDAELQELQPTTTEGEVQSTDERPYGEAAWLAHLELKFVLRAHRMELLRALGRSLGASATENGSPTVTVAA